MKSIKYIIFTFILLTSLNDSPLQGAENASIEGLSKQKIERFHRFHSDKQNRFKRDVRLISKGLEAKIPQLYHILDEVNYDKGFISLTDGSKWKISWWYKGAIKTWQRGDRVKIYYHGAFDSVKIENIDKSKSTWGSIDLWPNSKNAESITRISIKKKNIHQSEVSVKLFLKSGFVFQIDDIIWSDPWAPKESVLVLHIDGQTNSFIIANTTKMVSWKSFSLVGYEKENGPSREEILSLENRLNERVISQHTATKAVADALINSYSGLRDPNTPIGVFLFLGPTGVGKTELVKTLSDELYKSQSRLIRFDMSQFNTKWTVTRLIGSAPGYVDSEKGGQLTDPLLEQPKSIVLLDEIEKADDEVRKFFLPVFDEGYIYDARGQKVDATQALFFMTSNLGSAQIVDLYDQGYEEDAILKMLEPELMKKLSPELYNRVEPIVFRPLTEEAIAKLVELMLEKVVIQVKNSKDMTLIIDSSVKDYLAKEGYHPLLGARPLKRLIQKKVIANISYALIEQEIPEGSTITLYYFPEDDQWDVACKPFEKT